MELLKSESPSEETMKTEASNQENCSEVKTENPEQVKEEVKYFECETCLLKNRYEYFGSNPPFLRKFLLLEDAYVIEDPFLPPRQGEILILGAQCVKCFKRVCKDPNCSLYFEGTYCIRCAKDNIQTFPVTIQDKLKRVIT